jgi:phosphatidylglycerophosphate synthase
VTSPAPSLTSRPGLSLVDSAKRPRLAVLAIPSFVTGIGFALRALALVGLLSPLVGLVGLLCDALDGALARRLGAETRFGAALDWHADCACAVLAAVVLTSRAAPSVAAVVVVAVVGALVLVWGTNHPRGVRVSGSAPLVVLALGALWWGS